MKSRGDRPRLNLAPIIEVQNQFPLLSLSLSLLFNVKTNFVLFLSNLKILQSQAPKGIVQLFQFSIADN